MSDNNIDNILEHISNIDISYSNNDNILKYINDRIKKEICYNIIEELKDINLIEEYKKSKSVKNEINTLKKILENNNVNNEKITLILNDYLIHLIPPGTKGVIRGNKFNNIIKNKINSMKMDPDKYDVCFEKNCQYCMTSEIPDWYILNKKTKKVIIGMNQLDLWSGGQQINRGFKYIINNKYNTENSKLLCVVCNYIELKNNTKKVYKIFESGFSNNTICYINNLENIILQFIN
jgi:hypothetical protein